MLATVKSLGIDRLSREQRIDLVRDIWDTIAVEQPPPLSEAKRDELARRVAADDATPDDVIPWEQVKTQTLARLKKP